MLENENCEQLIVKVQELINYYYFYDEGISTTKLDSALQIIDSIEGKCGKYDANICCAHLMILSIKSEYRKGLKYAKSLDDKLFTSQYKSVIIHRFKAMIAQSENDNISKKKHIKDIISILKSQINQAEMDSILLLSNADEIIKMPKFWLLFQYYYYRAQLEGYDIINKEIDSLQVNWVKQEEYSPLKPSDDDFMIFVW
jgi:hypothetical protein